MNPLRSSSGTESFHDNLSSSKHQSKGLNNIGDAKLIKQPELYEMIQHLSSLT